LSFALDAASDDAASPHVVRHDDRKPMSWLVQPRPVNGPFDDPGLFVDFRFGRRALLFDLGDVSALSARELLRVSHVFVSHTHVDHFVGFDRLLRISLHRSQPLHLFGPADFAERVAAKLAAYTWNLLGETSPDFTIEASELVAGRIVRMAAFHAREAFRRKDVEPPELPESVLLEEEDFRVETTVLDHGTPCLAFALQERMRVNVWKDGLAALGLPVGPWLNTAKQAVRRSEPDNTRVTTPNGPMPLGGLKESAFRVAPGQRLAYVTDTAGTDENAERIVALARGADQLFIEAVFLEADRELAEANHHLTASMAGSLARRAGASRATPFHFSARYVECAQAVRDEFEAAFACTGEPVEGTRVLPGMEQED
jgi:ribonuclease Z